MVGKGRGAECGQEGDGELPHWQGNIQKLAFEDMQRQIT